jgi:hypothetical protein
MRSIQSTHSILPVGMVWLCNITHDANSKAQYHRNTALRFSMCAGLVVLGAVGVWMNCTETLLSSFVIAPVAIGGWNSTIKNFAPFENFAQTSGFLSSLILISLDHNSQCWISQSQDLLTPEGAQRSRVC